MEIESAIKARPIRGILLSFIKPACSAKPIKVPAVSKNATNKKTRTTDHNWGLAKSGMCAIPTPNVGFILGIDETICVGKGINFVTKPRIVVKTIPIKIEPGTFLAIKRPVTTSPKIVNHVVGTVKEPISTSVDLLAVTRPPPCKPTKAMKSPIPEAIANFKSCGIESMTISRNFKTEINKNRILDMKTPAIAVCQGIPIARTTE
jgi:hypothetical protein